jgi:hypothetical protein
MGDAKDWKTVLSGSLTEMAIGSDGNPLISHCTSEKHRACVKRLKAASKYGITVSMYIIPTTYKMRREEEEFHSILRTTNTPAAPPAQLHVQ